MPDAAVQRRMNEGSADMNLAQIIVEYINPKQPRFVQDRISAGMKFPEIVAEWFANNPKDAELWTPEPKVRP